MRRITADIIYPITSNPLTDHVLLLEDDGTILNIQPLSEFDETTVEKFSGALVPGFINTHCHIELSHLKDQFPEKTGLPEFLNLVTAQREHNEEIMLNAISSAEKEMIKNGIVAVGDISNLPLSFSQKAKRNLYYHTFIELISFDPFKAGLAMEHGNNLIAEARGFGIHTSLAPHATYSVSSELIKKISKQCYESGKPTSIHMLESNDENEFYVRGTGLYRKLYRDMKRDIKHFTPTGKTALESLLPDFDPQVKTLLVHNTIATEWDAEWAEDIHPNLYWCFCPNANLFIEDRLPDIPMLMKHVQYITIGTDSLASNHGLSILEELISIQNKFPEINSNDLLRWATLYGAKFLGIDDKFGSFDVGKKPGVNLIKDYSTGALQKSVVEKIM